MSALVPNGLLVKQTSQENHVFAEVRNNIWFDYDEWYEHGGKSVEFRRQSATLKRWSGDGSLAAMFVCGEGVLLTGVRVPEWSIVKGRHLIVRQVCKLEGTIVETRTSPPWFTEAEILQAVERVEE